MATIDRHLEEIRTHLHRRSAGDAARAVEETDALLVDIRPVEQRRRDGTIPGSLVIDRNVLEWRLDPTSPDRIEAVAGPEQVVILVCNEGYASSLAARSLQQIGLPEATDLIGGFQAWRAAGLAVDEPQG